MDEENYKKKYGPAAEFIINRKKSGKGLPWAKAWSNINFRCTQKSANKYKYYGGLGIQCRITSIELKELFIRDRAYLMSNPSVDRIDPNGHYEKSNIQWIEFSENRIKRTYGKRDNFRFKKKISCDKCNGNGYWWEDRLVK